MDDPDLALLARHAHQGDEAAFAEIVRRHLALVHSVALRHVRSPQLAEEVAQSVFSDLARQARRLGPGTVLSAWLWQVARRTAVDAVRREARRRRREQAAHELSVMNTPDADWSQVAPLLDEALQSLDETDRAVVVLRWFENKPLREVGAALGLGEDAAQKRASRALDRLREFFAQRGVTASVGGLAAVMSAHAVQTAPAGLAALVTGGATNTSWLIALSTTLLTMTTANKITLVFALCLAGGAVPAYRHFQTAPKPSRSVGALIVEPIVLPDPATDLAVEPEPETESAPEAEPAAVTVDPALLLAELQTLLAQPPRPTVPPPSINQLNLRDAPLSMVFDLLEGWTGRRIVRSEDLPTAVVTVSITNPVPLPLSEAVSAVISALYINGIGLVAEGDQIYRAVALR